jgi:hypothetical protein
MPPCLRFVGSAAHDGIPGRPAVRCAQRRLVLKFLMRLSVDRLLRSRRQ